MNQRFAGKLPALMVMPFAYALPFGEVIAGALILFGLFTRLGLTLSGLLLIWADIWHRDVGRSADSCAQPPIRTCEFCAVMAGRS